VLALLSMLGGIYVFATLHAEILRFSLLVLLTHYLVWRNSGIRSPCDVDIVLG